MEQKFSNRLRLLSILLLVTGIVSAAVVYRTSANNTKQNRGQGKRVPLTVLQSSEPAISSNYSKKTMLAPAKDGQSLYSLNSMTGDLSVFQKNGKPAKKVANSFLNVEAFAVGPQQELYLAQSDSTVRTVSSDGRQLNSFRTVYPKSIAVLGNGNVVVASPFNGKNLHLYNGQGLLLASFGDLRSFHADFSENEFLNEGRVVVGPGDQIYYVSTYAPQPYVLRFSAEGQLLGEFPIEGEAVDLQTDFAKEFLERREFCRGGVTVITSAAVSPETGHLWLGINGLSTQGTVYEYDQTGNKVRELAFLLNPNTKLQNVTHVKDIAVSGDSLSILTWGGTYGFKLGDVLIADAWKVPAKTSEPIKPSSSWSAWANPLNGIAKFWAPAPVVRPGIPQPPQGSCPAAQDFSCTANCPQGTTPQPADCGAQIAITFPTNQSRRVTQKSCTAKPIDSTPGSSTPGGCTETVNWCDTSNPNITGSFEVSVNCTAVPTPTPTPTPTPEEGGGCNGQGELCTPHDGCCDGLMCSAFQCQPLFDPDSPIVVDINGDGFSLTNAANGVDFDIAASGTPKRLAWTSSGADDAWLVLDRNANGLIDNGQELFGNHTPQPEPPLNELRNGFLALAEYDKPQNGGNGDGLIDNRDSVFNSLRLWQDRNHNGISEQSELQPLSALGVDSIATDYKLSKKTDQWGNQFRYRAKAGSVKHTKTGRWAWDVFLLAQ